MFSTPSPAPSHMGREEGAFKNATSMQAWAHASLPGHKPVQGRFTASRDASPMPVHPSLIRHTRNVTRHHKKG